MFTKNFKNLLKISSFITIIILGTLIQFSPVMAMETTLDQDTNRPRNIQARLGEESDPLLQQQRHPQVPAPTQAQETTREKASKIVRWLAFSCVVASGVVDGIDIGVDKKYLAIIGASLDGIGAILLAFDYGVLRK